MSHKRRFSRLPFTAESTLNPEGGGKPIASHLLDISLKGALVEVAKDIKLTPGEKFHFELKLENSDVTIAMSTEVAHQTEDHVGLYCNRIDMDSMVHLRRLMELNMGDPELMERELVSMV